MENSSGDEFFDACETEDQIALFQRSSTVPSKAESGMGQLDFSTVQISSLSLMPRTYTEITSQSSVEQFTEPSALAIIEKIPIQPPPIIEFANDYKVSFT